MISHSRLDIAKEEIKARLSIQQVVEHLTGKQFVRGAISCPFHNEKTASFRLTGNSYKCFGCSEYGDVISFTMKHNGLSFRDAITWLDAEFELGILNQRVTVAQQVQARRRKQEQVKRQLEEQRKRLEYDRICRDYRICNEALRKGILEPFSDLWAYYIDLQCDLEKQLWRGGHYGS